MTKHFQRQLNRVESTRISKTEVLKRLAVKLPAARRHPSCAVLLATLPVITGSQLDSNGDRLYAIVRGGTPITALLRRSTQDCTPEALKVDAVI